MPKRKRQASKQTKRERKRKGEDMRICEIKASPYTPTTASSATTQIPSQPGRGHGAGWDQGKE